MKVPKKFIGITAALYLGLVLYFVHQDADLLASSQAQSGSAPLVAGTTAFYDQEKEEDPPLVSPVARPVRLSIPAINVDAAVEDVGVTADGAMDVPKNIDDVAWFASGQRPGELGSAVIAGHYGWKDGKAPVFDRLHELRPGDKIYVEDETGAAIAFVVVDRRKYDPDADAPEVFGSRDGKAHLNLITCAGAWNQNQQSYTDRLVLFTDRE